MESTYSVIVVIAFLLMSTTPALGQGSTSTNVQVTRRQADSGFQTMLLFRENGIDFDKGTRSRMVRDEHGTVVWVQNRFMGLPIFDHDIGYSFDSSGKVDREPDTGKPRLLGGPMPPASAFPVDLRPDIARDGAIATWLAKIRTERQFGADYEPRLGTDAVLGFYDLNLGTGKDPEFRLAWRVRPDGDFNPMAMVDAKKGGVLHFDAGARTTAAPSPQPEPTVESLIGTWTAAACGARKYTRQLTLQADGRFAAIDYVAPCPRGQICKWSGIVRRSGTWQARNLAVIELSVDTGKSRLAEPIPGAMGFDPLSGRLHEATPGAGPLCKYDRVNGAESAPSSDDRSQ